ncbi:MAG TPA: hypothetical protein VGU22_06060 [Methylomirabilota bacterium]|jgi:hypothetical protein|nr:hypothetical protein [Methylomirabilota bacterium]
MRTLRLVALTIVAVLMLTAVANAACATTDLNNTTWYVYVSASQSWTRCIVTIGPTGVVANGTACRSYNGSTHLFSNETVVGGNVLAVTTSCLMTSRFVKTNVSGTHTITEAMLDRGKNILTGYGKDTADGSGWSFTAVRK